MKAGRRLPARPCHSSPLPMEDGPSQVPASSLRQQDLAGTGRHAEGGGSGLRWAHPPIPNPGVSGGASQAELKLHRGQMGLSRPQGPLPLTPHPHTPCPEPLPPTLGKSLKLGFLLPGPPFQPPATFLSLPPAPLLPTPHPIQAKKTNSLCSRGLETRALGFPLPPPSWVTFGNSFPTVSLSFLFGLGLPAHDLEMRTRHKGTGCTGGCEARMGLLRRQP